MSKSTSTSSRRKKFKPIPAGGRFEGYAELIFLYPHNLIERWPHSDIPQPDKRHYLSRRIAVLLSDVHYHCANCITYTAPKGILTDGGTIRTMLGWGIASTPFRDYLPAFLVHDHYCREAGVLRDNGALEDARKLRAFADDLFNAMLIDLGAGAMESWLMWKSVRLGAKIGGF